MNDDRSSSIKHLKITRFGEKLRTLRERRSMSLAELATVPGYSSSQQVSHLEVGRRNPTAEVILKVSKLFTVSADVLLDDTREVEG